MEHCPLETIDDRWPLYLNIKKRTILRMHTRAERILRKKALVKVEKTLSKKRYKCLHEGCEELAVKSHSQQKNGPLRSIADDNNKVYRLDDDLQRSYELDKDDFKFNFALKGIVESSVFPGFCNEHEKLFSIFENEEITGNNNQQFCALFYRTHCYEKSRKRREVDRWSQLSKDFADIYGGPQYSIDTAVQAHRKHIRNTSDYQIKIAYNMMKNGDYSPLTTKHVVIPKNLNVSCSSTINLHLDDFPAYAAKHPDSPLPGFTFNLLPGKQNTHIVFSWLKEFDTYAQWLNEAIENEDQFERFLNRFAFCDSEDACINPTLWNSIDSEQVIKNMHHTYVRGKLADDMIPTIIEL